MDYWEHIEKVIDYIEENLQCEVNLADCARVAGYSPYHFLRVFRDVVGLTPAAYVRKRRISEISKEIMQGGIIKSNRRMYDEEAEYYMGWGF